MRQVKLFLIAGLAIAAVAISVGATDKDAKKVAPDSKAEQPKAAAPEAKPAGITWMEYDAGLLKAEKENKHVFIDFTAKWCGWCKKMDRETFQEPDVVKLINDHFVPVRVDGDSPHELDIEGFKITEKNLTRSEFGVRGFPSFWFLKPDGTKLGKIDGYRDKNFMMEALTFVKEKKYDQPQQPAVSLAKRQEAVEQHTEWPGIIKQAILDGRIEIGMTKEQVRASIGEPKDMNRTVSEGSVQEQWVYESIYKYVYFENGVLKSWQD